MMKQHLAHYYQSSKAISTYLLGAAGAAIVLGSPQLVQAQVPPAKDAILDFGLADSPYGGASVPNTMVATRPTPPKSVPMSAARNRHDRPQTGSTDFAYQAPGLDAPPRPHLPQASQSPVSIIPGLTEDGVPPSSSKTQRPSAGDGLSFEPPPTPWPTANAQPPHLDPQRANAYQPISKGLPDYLATDLFAGGTESLVAKAIGAAEGTRTPDGDYTAAYHGHVDPGNGVWNQGTFSYQHGAKSPEEADQRQLERLRRQADWLNQKAISEGIALTLAEKLSALDLANQAPRAALENQGYIDWLKQAHELGMRDSEAIVWARVRSFFDPTTGALDAPGLDNNVATIVADQERRTQAILRAIAAHKPSYAQSPPSAEESQRLSSLPALPLPNTRRSRSTSLARDNTRIGIAAIPSPVTQASSTPTEPIPDSLNQTVPESRAFTPRRSPRQSSPPPRPTSPGEADQGFTNIAPGLALPDHQVSNQPPTWKIEVNAKALPTESPSPAQPKSRQDQTADMIIFHDR